MQRNSYNAVTLHAAIAAFLYLFSFSSPCWGSASVGVEGESTGSYGNLPCQTGWRYQQDNVQRQSRVKADVFSTSRPSYRQLRIQPGSLRELSRYMRTVKHYLLAVDRTTVPRSSRCPRIAPHHSKLMRIEAGLRRDGPRMLGIGDHQSSWCPSSAAGTITRHPPCPSLAGLLLSHACTRIAFFRVICKHEAR